MSKLNEVQQRLSEISPNKFHKLVDSYLSKKYNYSIHSTGTKTGEDKPRKGTPDTLITLENGHYIFVEYTTQKTNIKKKFIDDIKKCLEPKKTSIEISKIDKIILACNSSLQSDDIEALQQACNNIKCEVITNSTLSYDLVNYYPTIAKDFLGIDIGHLLTPNILKEKYLNNFKTISLLTNTPKSIDNIFVNLAIIKEREEKQDKIKLIKREPILNSYEEIHKPKEPIAIKELINISKKSLIYGKAGIGKTTLCKHIAYKWAKGGFYQEFEYIIYLPLREWKNGGIKGAIKDYYYSLDKKELNIDFNAYKILFLFDGYDELDGDKKKDLREEIKKYNLTHYIITTRPYGHQKSDFRVDEYFETIGFSDENVEEYIDAFFKENNNKAKSLKAYLKTNISIKHIGYIPLMLEMICSQWKKEEFNESLTMTELYTQSIENIFFEYTEKNGTAYIQDKEEEIFNYLGKIAFEGLKQQTIVLDKKIIKEKRSFFSDYVLKAGFLNDGKAEKSNPLLNSYQFPHLTFQEYFSALYVSKLKKKKIKKIIQKYKFYPHMQMFFAFLGGLSEDIEDKEFLLQEIESEPKDLVGFYEFKIMNFCIKDMRYKDIEDTRKKKIFEHFFLNKKSRIIILKEKSFSSYHQNLKQFLHIINDDFIEMLINKKEYYVANRLLLIDFLKFSNLLLSIINKKELLYEVFIKNIRLLASNYKANKELKKLFIDIINLLIKNTHIHEKLITSIFYMEDNINDLFEPQIIENLINKVQNPKNNINGALKLSRVLKYKGLNRKEIKDFFSDNIKYYKHRPFLGIYYIEEKNIEEIKITSFSFKDIMLDCTGIDDKKEIILDSKSYIDSYINSVMNSFVAILLQENIENTIEKDIIKTFFQLEYPFPFIVIYDSLIDTFFKIISNKNIFKKDVRKNIAILLAIFNNKTIESYTTISNRFEKLIKSDKYIKKIYLECDTKRHNKQNISQEKKYNRQNNTFSKSYQNENISEEIILEKIEKYFYRNKEFVFEFSNSEKIVSIKIKNKNKKDKLIAERIIKLEVLSKFIQKNNNLKERFMKYYTENSLDYNIYSIVIDIFIDINEVDFLIDIYKQGEAWTIINHLLSLNNESVAKKIIPLINSNIIESFLDKTKDFQLIIDSLLFYNQNFDITKKIIKFFVEKEMPLYLSKDKHLCTIENGKEISTQREVDEATLNEIKIMLRGDNHYEK